MEKGTLHSLIPLGEFKLILGLDDREDALAGFVLTTATYSIEQYCRRPLLKRIHRESLDYYGDYLLPGYYVPLREYPVRSILGVWVNRFTEPEHLLPEQYHCIPALADDNQSDLYPYPFSLTFTPAVKLRRGEGAVKVHYWAGYTIGKVPPDLASACMELAAWNFNRYRGKRIGITGAVRGKGADGEHLEPSMPEQVRLLLEPYRRRLI
jgi:hypothetical protein